jgi:hypothetical protein
MWRRGAGRRLAARRALRRGDGLAAWGAALSDGVLGVDVLGVLGELGDLLWELGDVPGELGEAGGAAGPPDVAPEFGAIVT